MTQFSRNLPPDTPQTLFHYTKASNLKSMLRDDTKSICFWLKNNRDKNDKVELQMGIKLMQKVRDYLDSIHKSTLLSQLSDFENSYSLSFTEKDVNRHMLTEYGPVRLEFDLREFSEGKPQKCEYYTYEDIDELAVLYMEDFNRLRHQSSITNLLLWVIAEEDIIQKIATIKRKNEWEQEGEWRIIMHKQVNDPKCIFAPDGTQRLVLNIPISFLKRITLFYDNGNKVEMNEMSAYLEAWKMQNNVKTFEVVMEDATKVENLPSLRSGAD